MDSFYLQLLDIHQKGHPVKWDSVNCVLQVIPNDKGESSLVGKITAVKQDFITLRFPLRIAHVQSSYIKEITFSTMDEKHI